MMILTCFIHIICHYYAFSGTNLLTRCRRASCCFLQFLVWEILVRKYSRNRMKSTPSILFFHEASRTPESSREGPQGHHTLGRRGQGLGRAGLWSGGPVPPLWSFPGVLDASGENRNLGVDFVRFREYFVTRISETKNSRKQELALRHLVNRLVPENARIWHKVCIKHVDNINNVAWNIRNYRYVGDVSASPSLVLLVPSS